MHEAERELGEVVSAGVQHGQVEEVGEGALAGALQPVAGQVVARDVEARHGGVLRELAWKYEQDDKL